MPPPPPSRAWNTVTVHHSAIELRLLSEYIGRQTEAKKKRTEARGPNRRAAVNFVFDRYIYFFYLGEKWRSGVKQQKKKPWNIGPLESSGTAIRAAGEIAIGRGRLFFAAGTTHHRAQQQQTFQTVPDLSRTSRTATLAQTGGHPLERLFVPSLRRCYFFFIFYFFFLGRDLFYFCPKIALTETPPNATTTSVPDAFPGHPLRSSSW